MKILVTGATGFIGRYVVERLLANGHEVVTTSLHGGDLPYDLNNRLDDAFVYFGRPEALIHLAWEGLPNYTAPFHLEENLPRHIAFLESLIRGGLRDITVTGTCLEYGMQEGCLGEDLPARPGNPYAQAKNELRKRLEALQSDYPFVLRWVRLFYMYGKGQNPKSLLSQLDKALEEKAAVFNMSGGEQWRDFLPVETVAEYVVRIATQQKVSGVINCCSGHPVSVKAFVEDYLRRTNGHIALNLGYYPYPDYEPMRFWGDNTKLKTLMKDDL